MENKGWCPGQESHLLEYQGCKAGETVWGCINCPYFVVEYVECNGG